MKQNDFNIGDKVKVVKSNMEIRELVNYHGEKTTGDICIVTNKSEFDVILDNECGASWINNKFITHYCDNKKEIAGVDFVYGIELVPAGFFCCGCLFIDTDGECIVDECLACTAAGEDKSYAPVKIPRKKPHVVGLAKIGAWLEVNGFVFDREIGEFSSEKDTFDGEHVDYYKIRQIFSLSGQEIKSILGVPKELIEYK